MGVFVTGRLFPVGFRRAQYEVPCFIYIYINNLDWNITGMIKKFADDIKIGCVVDTE